MKAIIAACSTATVGLLSRRALYSIWVLLNRHQSAVMEISAIVLSRGYPSLFGGGIMAGAPFDHFADLLRGTRGIVMDMYRQPAKLHEAMDRWLNLMLMSIKDFPMTPSPICMMPLHKGDDTFMSDKQFEEFYWPTLRKVLMA